MFSCRSPFRPLTFWINCSETYVILSLRIPIEERELKQNLASVEKLRHQYADKNNWQRKLALTDSTDQNIGPLETLETTNAIVIQDDKRETRKETDNL